MKVKTIQGIPTGHEDDVFVVSTSGGKDSTAAAAEMTALAKRTGVRVRYVFADTGWEAPETYEYLHTIERALGITIDRVGYPGGMVAKIKESARFPARKQRWCTRELKINPITDYCHELSARENADIVQVVGIRADESESRAQMAEFERDDSRDVYVWRPLMGWSVEDVLAAHHRASVPVNPLYKRGHNRVGCWPCIYSSKEEIRLWAEHDPARVQEIADLERWCEEERERRNAVTPGRYTHDIAMFFQSRETKKMPDGKRVYLPVHVEDVVEWSKTARGGASVHAGSAAGWRVFPLGHVRTSRADGDR